VSSFGVEAEAGVPVLVVAPEHDAVAVRAFLAGCQPTLSRSGSRTSGGTIS